MYTLTLTKEERKAFDWVGYRYNAGAVSDLLALQCEASDEWGSKGDVAYIVPEYVAWKIAELAEQEDHLWPCFSAELSRKMEGFLGKIT